MSLRLRTAQPSAQWHNAVSVVVPNARGCLFMFSPGKLMIPIFAAKFINSWEDLGTEGNYYAELTSLG